MVDVDGDNTTYLPGSESVLERDKEVPLTGIRENFNEPAMQMLCTKQDEGVSTDFVLEGYQTCALQFSKRQFEQSINEEDGKKMITLYVNHPSQMNSWVETCQTVSKMICETVVLQ